MSESLKVSLYCNIESIYNTFTPYSVFYYQDLITELLVETYMIIISYIHWIDENGRSILVEEEYFFSKGVPPKIYQFGIVNNT